MHSMRDLITLLEAPRQKAKPAPAIAFNKDTLAGELMSLQAVVSGIRHGFQMTSEWTEEVVKQTNQAKLDFEASEASDRARYGEDEDYQPGQIDVRDVAGEIADKIAQAGIARFSIHSDTRTMEREYQDRKTTDPDNPMDYIEDSDFLRFLHVQDQFATVVENVVPSKFSTYAPFVQALRNCLDVYSNNSQDEELIWSSDLQQLVSHLIPLMRFCLKNI